ncbi:MAG: GNAT family N-acetyltransferase [Phycisphaerae bacterium]|nr:GNAT family N-acetyltransferase [Phycisphaerae bacterium]
MANGGLEETGPISFCDDVSSITADQLRGFFVGWPACPSPERHLDILHGSDRAILAIDETTGRAVGFITAVTDGVLTAYIPLLEVLPEYQKRGIGGELLRRMLDEFADLYMTDLVCDPPLQAFYERAGMHRGMAMVRRDRAGMTGERR